MGVLGVSVQWAHTHEPHDTTVGKMKNYQYQNGPSPSWTSLLRRCYILLHPSKQNSDPLKIVYHTEKLSISSLEPVCPRTHTNPPTSFF